VERKLKMVIIFVPFENEQSSQIGIFEELAISLVALLVPASYLTGLSTLILASNQHNKGNISMAVLPCRNTRKTNTCCTVEERLSFYRTRDTF
jgi:hypothetical protein